MKKRYEIEIAPTTALEDEQRMRAATNSLMSLSSAVGEPPMTVEISPPVLRLGTIDPAAIQSVLDSLRSSGCIIRRVQAVRPSLEDLFFAAVGQTPSPVSARGVAWIKPSHYCSMPIVNSMPSGCSGSCWWSPAWWCWHFAWLASRTIQMRTRNILRWWGCAPRCQRS